MTEPVFTATPQGADDVIRAGNRRRLLSGATAALSAVTVLAVMMATPWERAQPSDVITPIDEPSAGSSASAGSTPRLRLPDASTSQPGAPAQPGAPTTTSTGAPASRQAGTGPSLSAPRPPAPARSPQVRQVGSPITRGTSSTAADDLCSTDQTQAAGGWCVRYVGPATARRGVPVALTMELCRLGSFPAAAVTFESTREALMSVDGADWSAGEGEKYTSPGRTVNVPPTRCLTWTSTWDTRGSDGFLVLPGRYAVHVGVESELSLSGWTGGYVDVTD